MHTYAAARPQGIRAAFESRTLLWVALGLGLAVRLIVLANTAHLTPQIADEKDYAELARHVLAGDGLAWGPGQPTSIRPPLYPAFIAGIWTVTGVDNFQAVRVVQIALGVVIALLTAQIGRRLYGDQVGRLAGVVAWLYPSLIFANFEILTETLFTTLLLTFVLLAIMLLKQPRLGAAIACGAALGLAALARSIVWPTPLLLCPLFLWLLPSPFSRRVLLSAALVLGFAVVVGPWAVRNTRLQGVVEIVDTMGGLNLRMGNYEYTPEDRMWDAVALHGHESWVFALSQEHPGESFTEGQKDKWAQKKAIEYIRAHPGTTLRRDLIKLADFWELEREFIAGVQQGLFNPPLWFAILASVAMLVAYVAVVFAGAAGMWLKAPDWRAHILLLLPVVLISGLHAIVFGHSRYHLPLMPILAIYGSALLVAPPAVAWRRAPALLRIGAVVTIVLLLGAWIRNIAFVDADRIKSLFNHF